MVALLVRLMLTCVAKAPWLVVSLVHSLVWVALWLGVSAALSPSRSPAPSEQVLSIRLCKHEETLPRRCDNPAAWVTLHGSVPRKWQEQEPVVSR